jgi:hypothetical protein
LAADRSRVTLAGNDRLPLRPERLRQFRLARLLVLLDVAAQQKPLKPIDIERLAFYDFFAANPFLIFDEEDAERRDIILAGFNANSLSYNSSAQRFTNRRARLQHDLTLLIAYALVEAETVQSRVSYGVTERGSAIAKELRALYAVGYRESASIVIRRLNKLSDKRLREEARRWLRAEGFLIDIYDESLS